MPTQHINFLNAFAIITFVVGALFLKETKDRDISTYQHE